jgi:hypothetical protein
MSVVARLAKRRLALPGSRLSVRRSRAAFFFAVLEPGVEDVFDAAKLGAPEVAEVVQALVEGGNARVDLGEQDRDQQDVRYHGNADCEIELGVGHGEAPLLSSTSLQAPVRWKRLVNPLL